MGVFVTLYFFLFHLISHFFIRVSKVDTVTIQKKKSPVSISWYDNNIQSKVFKFNIDTYRRISLMHTHTSKVYTQMY